MFRIIHEAWAHITVSLTFLLLSSLTAAQEESHTDWPGFRGVGAKGTADGFETAVRWDATNPDDKLILWKSPVPGLGHSCPTIVGNRIFVATAISQDEETQLQVGASGDTKAANDKGEQSWVVLCYDKHSGKELWRKTAHTGIPKATRHTKASHANTTVAVDGDNVVAFFGSEGLFCYDLDGKLKWKKDLGVVDVGSYGIGWGYGSSPSIHNGHIVLVCDDPTHAFIIALSLDNGEEIWRRSRKDVCERSWGTPLIHEVDGRAQVVVNGWPLIVAYDLTSGDEIWRIEGGGDNPIPSPFIVNDHIYVTNAHGAKSPVIAIRRDAKGNLTESESSEKAGLAWRIEKGGSYMSTPVVVGDHIYLGNTNGVLRCFHTKTGKKVYEKRLGNGVYIVSSLVAANDKIYCAAEDGTVYVIAAGPEFKVLSKNRLGDACLATPAISAGILYFRTAHSLMAIGSISKADPQEADSTNGKKPNVLFIAVDDLRPNLGCYGDAVAITPNIDRLAERGVRFNRAYCQVAVCNPSRASLMTGLRPDTLGVWTLPIHFREAKPDAVTLPQWLRKSGYTAVSHGKIYHNPTPDPQSWSEPIRDLTELPEFYPDGTHDRLRVEMEKLPKTDWRKDNLRGPATASPDLADNQLLDGARTDMCIEDLKRLGKANEPFFLAMGFIRPHLSFVAPKKYWELYDADSLPVLTGEQMPDGAPSWALHNNSELSHYVDMMDVPPPWNDIEIDEAAARRLVHGYYACVSFVDAQIGRLLDALDEQRLTDNTIVVLWSDHGWKLGDYRGWGKMTNYEIDARVPFIISAPRMTTTAGKSTESLVELLDIYPTLCDLAGIDSPDFVEGKSLTPVLRNVDAKVHEAAVNQYYRRHEDKEYMGYALRTDRHRYIEWREFATGEIRTRELYDYSGTADSHLGKRDTKNIADTAAPELLNELAMLLNATHPPKKLSMVPAVHTSPSGDVRQKAKINFRNDYDSEISVYPIQPSGQRAKGRNLAAGESVSFNARLGGAYVVESKDGTIFEIHAPSWPEHDVVIDR